MCGFSLDSTKGIPVPGGVNGDADTVVSLPKSIPNMLNYKNKTLEMSHDIT